MNDSKTKISKKYSDESDLWGVKILRLWAKSSINTGKNIFKEVGLFSEKLNPTREDISTNLLTDDEIHQFLALPASQQYPVKIRSRYSEPTEKYLN